jgi:polar amino acid transport system substrate-binding protein
MTRFFHSFFNLLFSKPIIEAFLIAFALLLFFAHCIWLFERYKNSDRFPHSYWAGIKESIWWTAITVTIAGYGNKAPKTSLGRFTSVIWMFTSIFFIAFFTATITSSLTVQKLYGSVNGPEDLPGKRIGVVQQSTAARFLRDIYATPVSYPTIQAVFEGFEKEEVDIVVYDSPLLQHYAKTKGSGAVTTVGTLFEKQDYGILLPQGSQDRETVNRAILKLKESGVYDELLAKWFGG